MKELKVSTKPLCEGITLQPIGKNSPFIYSVGAVVGDKVWVKYSWEGRNGNDDNFKKELISMTLLKEWHKDQGIEMVWVDEVKKYGEYISL